MTRLQGRVAIVTGAGRGLGREHALCLAQQGASVVVNDLGVDLSGAGADNTPAQQVVREIVERGGRAIASGHDVADWKQAQESIEFAVKTFGDLHVLVNNAGFLRDRSLANMSESEWDQVIRVHLKGHAAMSRHAVAYWKERAKAGVKVKASLIHTTSVVGFTGNYGQANYCAAKLGIIALSRVIAIEAGKLGVRSNAVSPSARTRMTMNVPGTEQYLDKPKDEKQFDPGDPANVSPLIAWLAEENCPANSQVFQVISNRIMVVSMPTVVHELHGKGRWTLEELDRELPSKLLHTPSPEEFLGLDVNLVPLPKATGRD